MAYSSRNVVIALIVVILILLIVGAYLFTRPGAPVETTPTYTPTPTPGPMPTPTPTPAVTPTTPPATVLPEKIVIGFTVPLSGRLAKEGNLALAGI